MELPEKSRRIHYHAGERADHQHDLAALHFVADHLDDLVGHDAHDRHAEDPDQPDYGVYAHCGVTGPFKSCTQ